MPTFSVQCPRCHVTQNLSAQFDGRWIHCNRCKFGFVAVGEENDGLPASHPPPLQPRRSFRFGWLLGVGVLAAIIVLIGIWLIGIVAGPPATCREFVELLQVRGLKCEMIAAGGPFPKVFVSDRGYESEEYLRELMRHVGYAEGVAVIEQYPTAQQAMEVAGGTKRAFNHGRFLIYGDPQMVEEIRRRL